MSDLTSELLHSSGKLVAGKSAIFSGIHADILMGGESAPMTVMAMTVAPEQGAPDHISHGEDKIFQVMEGHLLFSVGKDKLEASAGERIFVGRGVAHSFSALYDEPAVMTLVSTPALHDRFFAAMDALPVPHDMSEVQAVCARFNQSIIGPVVK